MRPSPSWLRVAAGAVHLYTASGTVLGLLIVLAAIDGRVVTALWLGLVALIIDGTDGTLARLVKVAERLPWFDGARLDDVVDYLTYVFAPIVLLWATGRLPAGVPGTVLAALPLLASSYQFCRVDAKTEDHFFLGFPSYWNVIAFYAIALKMTPGEIGLLIAVCAALVFVPIEYLYPSRTRAFRSVTLIFTVGWLVVYAVILTRMPNPGWPVLVLSLLYLVYYFGMSIYLTVVKRMVARREPVEPTLHGAPEPAIQPGG